MKQRNAMDELLEIFKDELSNEIVKDLLEKVGDPSLIVKEHKIKESKKEIEVPTSLFKKDEE